MARFAGTHWLRGNRLERVPRRTLVVDTETQPLDLARGNQQVLRLWCARLVRRGDVDPKRPRQEDFEGHTAAELVELVDRLARSDHALWLFTHNLNFDLAVTELPVLLTESGWRLTEGALTTEAPWCRFVKGRRRLTVADSWSFLPTGVEQLGEALGLPKLPLPEPGASEAEWLRRCRRDVDITERSLSQLMDWWQAGQYGNWSITGPATGWSSYRHRKPRPHVLVEPDPDARDLEQRAVTGGRRSVARVGGLPLGLYADLDLITAHLTVMSSEQLPMERLRRFESLPLDARVIHARPYDVLAECTVELRSPRYPWQSGHGLFYPTGTFTTVLAGPELREALARDELRAIGPGYLYLMGDHMEPWAHWLAGLLDERNADVPEVARLAAKHWSRCVPGKWAGHTSSVIERIPDPRPGWHLERGWLSVGGSPADFLRIGGELWTIKRDEWADDAFPAILAWIQSHTRRALNMLLDLLGPAAVTCNTDGGLVDVRALYREQGGRSLGGRPSDRALLAWLDEWCADVSGYLLPFTVRPKGAAAGVTVLSPQHLLLDHERRLAGVPRKAVALGRFRYEFTAWPKLRLQLIREHGPGYVTDQRTVDLSHITPAGWLVESGAVIPPVVDLVDGSVVVRLPEWDQSAPGDRLAAPERQHTVLRRRLRESGWSGERAAA